MAKENNFKVEFKSQHHLRSFHQHGAAESPRSCSLDMLLRRLRAIEAKQDDKVTTIVDAVGEFGTFQRRLVALTFIPNILSTFFLFADIFMFTPQKPYCNTSWILAVGPNLTESERLNLTLPRAPNGSFLTCLMYLPVDWILDSIIHFGLNRRDSCQDGWIYPEVKKRSLINEFDSVCGKEPNPEIVQNMYLVGLLTGSFLFGFITDKLGRHPSILLSLLGLIIFGLGTAFVNSFHQYLFFRFGVSPAAVGYAISSASLTGGWLVGMHRAHTIILGHSFFAMGVMFLTGLAYSLPHWQLLFLVSGAPVFPFISYIWILPESPRWLMMKGKLKEAKQVLCYAAGVNKTIPLSLLDKLQLPGTKVTTASILDFYCNRHLRKVTLVMCSMRFAIVCNYYMLSLRMKELGVNIHFTHVIPGMMEVPARLCCIFLLEQLNRKRSLILTFFQGALMCFLSLLLPSGEVGRALRWPHCLATELKSLLVLIIVLGEFSLAATVTVFYIYTFELLPTVLRATGLGLLSLVWAAGGISSLIVVSQNIAILPVFLCCISACVALFFCVKLPETQDQPIPDSLKHLPPERRTLSEDMSSEDMLCDDVTEEVAKNTIFNATVTNVDQDSLSNLSLQSGEEEIDKQED
ncbi:solute carrier family 22 member 14 [Neophocaena asiaeorientalis asiaeorientalis]|uniref:Solute carrier family 22 member 14 n=1 Tax=Neophocaena asiaeorientalis asiaeorientalis TaxID=1706337 RepID=A0A341CDH2_NEOAA|nr:solute carrier family 22 member 14 [Neophocaena asiaeorientalis asiaeorientalis]